MNVSKSNSKLERKVSRHQLNPHTLSAMLHDGTQNRKLDHRICRTGDDLQDAIATAVACPVGPVCLQLYFPYLDTSILHVFKKRKISRDGDADVAQQKRG